MSRKIVVLLAEFAAISATLTGAFFLGDRSYYVSSFLVLFYILGAFFLSFEKRKPQAGDIVVIAVLCALAVVCRGIFLGIPNIMPAAAVIIIAGIELGAQAGFLVGAVTMFCSNFFASQGPWTPWQMFAYGLMGFLAGVCYKKGILKKTLRSTGMFAVVVTVLVTGPLLDTSTLLMGSTEMTAERAAAAYLAGLPVNLLHSGGTLLGLAVLLRTLTEKLERIKVKYGVMGNAF